MWVDLFGMISPGVVAYVEVRAKHENRSGAVAHALRKLGAIVESKFTNEVTHVIYKDGKMDGLATMWDKEGKVVDQSRFKNGVKVK